MSLETDPAYISTTYACDTCGRTAEEIGYDQTLIRFVLILPKKHDRSQAAFIREWPRKVKPIFDAAFIAKAWKSPIQLPNPVSGFTHLYLPDEFGAWVNIP